MNYKLEKFWNTLSKVVISAYHSMNYKLEKFWNTASFNVFNPEPSWTINLKSFEIFDVYSETQEEAYEL